MSDNCSCCKCFFSDCIYFNQEVNFPACLKCNNFFSNRNLKDNYYSTNNTNYNLICLSGKAGSGKDTVADYLYYNYDFPRYSFAHELKKLLIEAGWDKNKDIKGRRLLQQIGASFRNYNPYHWIDKLIKCNYKFNTEIVMGKMYKNICLVDCRHTNEIVDFARRLEYHYPDFHLRKQLNVCIEGPNYAQREMNSETENDISETALNDFKFDYVIKNDGTLEDMYAKIDKMMYVEFPEIKNKKIRWVSKDQSNVTVVSCPSTNYVDNNI